VIARAFVVACVLVAGGLGITHASKTEPVPPREALSTFPWDFREWHGQQAERFNQQILANLGVDDYISRVYSSPTGAAVGLYIGYYATQRQGETMHSPLNCLPGAGWQPMQKARVEIPIDGADHGPARGIVVNRLLIQKGLDRQVVIYWYQSHGRVVASEYWGKIYTVLDAVRLNRTDAAMVRVICPVSGSDSAATQAAEVATSFTQSLFPLLGRYLPD
jgi:EpsI family protein